MKNLLYYYKMPFCPRCYEQKMESEMKLDKKASFICKICKCELSLAERRKLAAFERVREKELFEAQKILHKAKNIKIVEEVITKAMEKVTI